MATGMVKNIENKVFDTGIAITDLLYTFPNDGYLVLNAISVNSYLRCRIFSVNDYIDFTVESFSRVAQNSLFVKRGMSYQLINKVGDNVIAKYYPLINVSV